MRTLLLGGLCSFAMIWALAGSVRPLCLADDVDPASAPPAEQKTDKPERPAGGEQPSSDAPPPDKQLLALHARFIKDAEKLANQYLKSRQPDRAVAVYEEILKLVPDEPAAKRQLEKLRHFEAVADRKVMEVKANADWQDTGVKIMAGKPYKLAATGTWTLNISRELGPDGMEMPKQLKDFKLGSLVGMVDAPGVTEPKVFVIGSSKDLTSDVSGPLMVRIHDMDPSDNQGFLKLEITGRFGE
jgi:hypothetical protein